MKARVGSLVLVGTLFLTACGGARYQVNVGNGHPRFPVQEVEVTADEKKFTSFPVIAPSKVAAAKPRRGNLPETLEVSWVDVEGNSHQATVPVSQQVRQGFKGQLVVEITQENAVTLTQVESSGDELSTLPWAMPEAWEGSVTLPGME